MLYISLSHFYSILRGSWQFFHQQTSNSWSIIEKGPREKFTTVAIYKGNFVAVKKVNKRTVELGRNVLMELKQVSCDHFTHWCITCLLVLVVIKQIAYVLQVCIHTLNRHAYQRIRAT